MYFPGDPLFPYDPVMNSVTDEQARQRMVAAFDLDATVDQWATGYRWFGRCRTGSEAGFAFATVRSAATADGCAPHLAFIVHSRGLLLYLHTRMHFPDDAEANAADPVLNAVPVRRRPTLIGEATAEGVRFDIRLQGEDETVFFDV